MKQPKLYRLALSTIASVFAYYNVFAFPAQAGGFASPDSEGIAKPAACSPVLTEGSDDQSDPDAKRKCKQQSQTFDWRYWLLPVSHGKNLCREHLGGNIVCLTPKSAARLLW